MTLLRRLKPISTLQFTAAAVGEHLSLKKKSSHSAFPSRSLQRKCSAKLSTVPLLLFSRSLPVGWMSLRKMLVPTGFYYRFTGKSQRAFEQLIRHSGHLHYRKPQFRNNVLSLWLLVMKCFVFPRLSNFNVGMRFVAYRNVIKPIKKQKKHDNFFSVSIHFLHSSWGGVITCC